MTAVPLGLDLCGDDLGLTVVVGWNFLDGSSFCWSFVVRWCLLGWPAMNLLEVWRPHLYLSVLIDSSPFAIVTFGSTSSGPFSLQKDLDICGSGWAAESCYQLYYVLAHTVGECAIAEVLWYIFKWTKRKGKLPPNTPKMMPTVHTVLPFQYFICRYLVILLCIFCHSISALCTIMFRTWH